MKQQENEERFRKCFIWPFWSERLATLFLKIEPEMWAAISDNGLTGQGGFQEREG